MGANASSEGVDQSARPSKTVEEDPDDYYTLLSVSVEATADEIKKGFRKQALIWHPDKNPNDVQRATERFAKIQQAYETLSDEQERAFYDSHRDELLNPDSAGGDSADRDYFNDLRRGGKPRQKPAQSRGVTAQQLMKFFHRSAWGDIDDCQEGFYSTFRTLFEVLAAEEVALGAPYYPSFGTSNSVYASTPAQPTDVRHFYSAWLNFATEKSFAWKDAYRVDEDMDRRTKRFVEKENARERSFARKEYNDTVRNLVLFVRRRDPRYTNSIHSDLAALRASEAERIKAELASASKERATQREREAAAYQAQTWQQAADGTGPTEWDDIDTEDEEEVDEEEVTWCPACEKSFRTGGAWANHERSRKHKVNVEKLVKKMQEEEDELGLNAAAAGIYAEDSDDEVVDDDTDRLAESVAGLHLAEEEQEALDRRKEREETPFFDAALDPSTPSREATPSRNGDLSADEDDDDQDVYAPGMARKSKGKRNKKNRFTLADSPARSETPESPSTSTPLDDLSLPKRKGRRKAKKGAVSSDDEDGSFATAAGSAFHTPEPEPEPVKSDGLSKKEKRRLKEAAKRAARGGGADDDDEKCNVCGESFPSRTKLFSHIRDTGHALATAH